MKLVLAADHVTRNFIFQLSVPATQEGASAAVSRWLVLIFTRNIALFANFYGRGCGEYFGLMRGGLGDSFGIRYGR